MEVLLMATVIIVVVAAVIDVKTRQIPLWSTATIFALGLAKGVFVLGPGGFVDSLAGSVALLLFFITLCAIYKIKLGGGDWKLIVAMGACIGVNDIVRLLPIVLIAVGVYPLAVLMYRNGTLNPVAQARALWDRAQLEKYEVAEPVKMAYGPALAVPFVIYTVLKTGGWW